MIGGSFPSKVQQSFDDTEATRLAYAEAIAHLAAVRSSPLHGNVVVVKNDRFSRYLCWHTSSG